jgi:hypothetical protein
VLLFLSMLLFQAELNLPQCVSIAEYVVVSGGAGKWTCYSVFLLLSMLLFQAELDLSQCAAVAEYVAVSGGSGPVTVCCCC